MWDDSSIFINNSPSPYRLLTGFPASIGILGTADLGYNATSTTALNYVTTGGTLATGTFVSDPLNTGSSVYRVASDMTIPTGATLTVEDGAILKFNLNLTLTVNGTLSVIDTGGGSPAIFTSFRDGSVGALIGDGTAAAKNDWNYIYARTNSVIAIDNAIIRYNQRAIYQYNEQTTSLSLSNTTISDSYYYGLELNAFTGQNISWNLDTVTFNNVGINTNYHGIYLNINNNATFSGNWNNVTLSNIGGSGIYIDDKSGGLVNPLISGLTVNGSIGSNGVQLIGSATTTPTFDNSSGSVNTINAGSYNLTLQGVGGSYSSLVLDGATVSSFYVSNGAAPTLFDGASITLGNSPSPYTLIGMAMPAQITSYLSGAGLVENYAILRGTLIADLTLSADPLGTGSSVWYMSSDLIVPVGITMTLEDNTVVKSTGVQLIVNGSLNSTATAGSEAYFTSFKDDDVNGDTNSDGASIGAVNDWYGIRFNSTSSGTVNNLIIKFANYALWVENVGSSLSLNDLWVDSSNYGVYLNSTATTAPAFDALTITNSNVYGLWLNGSGVMTPTFTGVGAISDVANRNAQCIRVESSDPNLDISGFVARECSYGLVLGNGAAGEFFNNVFSDSATNGVYISSTSTAAIVKNNVITSNDSNGVYCTGCNALIYGNLIRQNTADTGAGIQVAGNGSPIIKNNLIIENHSTNNDATGGGNGIHIAGTSNAQILNNTVALNTSLDVSNEGAGITLENTGGVVTLLDNIVFGNTDGNSVANDIYDENGNITENFNLIGADNIASNGPNDIFTDPLFTDAFYVAASEPVDAGSDVFTSLLTLGGLTITSDGLADSGIVDLGYHYATAAPVVHAANSTMIASNLAPSVNSSITITVTPRNQAGNMLGAGLIVEVKDSNDPVPSGTLGNRVEDHGNGSYTIGFTTTAISDATTNTQDTFDAIVNGVTLASSITVNW